MRIRRIDESLEPQDNAARSSRQAAQITFAVAIAAAAYFLALYLLAR